MAVSFENCFFCHVCRSVAVFLFSGFERITIVDAMSLMEDAYRAETNEDTLGSVVHVYRR